MRHFLVLTKLQFLSLVRSPLPPLEADIPCLSKSPFKLSANFIPLKGWFVVCFPVNSYLCDCAFLRLYHPAGSSAKPWHNLWELYYQCTLQMMLLCHAKVDCSLYSALQSFCQLLLNAKVLGQVNFNERSLRKALPWCFFVAGSIINPAVRKDWGWACVFT